MLGKRGVTLTASRRDITFVIGVCARYQAEPKMSDLTQVKRIVKYINSTSDYRVLYSYNEDSKLMVYCDADGAGSAYDRKTEYIAARSCCSQLVWMKQMLKEYNVEQNVLTLYYDNLSAINISKNFNWHQSRHPACFRVDITDQLAMASDLLAMASCKVQLVRRRKVARVVSDEFRLGQNADFYKNPPNHMVQSLKLILNITLWII
ncbi:hypothetical protein MTR_0046s0060 [Medicago truncatula]|uniref:RNA-directed DNA polymerase n=1 Tax=Medicago truncatula TaxID=3880 RepID=A0A072TI34_MEDTR|nr:hypothetical protein MTR_0046s0060 [Medicago truncatula]